MWRALVAFVGLLLAAGVYVLVTGGVEPSTAAAAPTAENAAEKPKARRATKAKPKAEE